MTTDTNPEGVSNTPFASLQDAGEAISQRFAEPRKEEVNHSEPEEGEAPEEEEHEQPEGKEGSETEGEEDPESGEEEEAEGEEEDQPTVDPSAKIKVKVDGEELEVTVEEAALGYQRQQDYTRKTQELTPLREGLQTQLKQAEQAIAHYGALYEQAYLEPYQNLDWAALKAEDPQRYTQTRMDYSDAQAQYQQVQQQYQAAQQQRAQMQHDSLREHVQVESGKLETEWAKVSDDPLTPERKGQVMEYAQSQGYSRDELSKVYDHRIVLLFEKARAYDALKGKLEDTKTKKVSKAPKRTVKGSATEGSKSAQQREQAVMQRLQQEHSVDAAAAAIAQRLQRHGTTRRNI